MSNNIVLTISRFIFLVLLQVLVLNNFQIMGAINPKVYILFLFLLPVSTSGSLRLLLAFALGLTIDTFENSGGIHTSATVLLAFIMPILHRLISTSGGVGLNQISISTLGPQKFLIYISLGVIIHHLWLFILEAFSFRNISWVMYEAIISSIATITIIYIVELLSNKKRDRI